VTRRGAVRKHLRGTSEGSHRRKAVPNIAAANRLQVEARQRPRWIPTSASRLSRTAAAV